MNEAPDPKHNRRKGDPGRRFCLTNPTSYLQLMVGHILVALGCVSIMFGITLLAIAIYRAFLP